MAVSRPLLARAKEVRSAAEHLITLAIRECDNTVSVEKTFNNDKAVRDRDRAERCPEQAACPPSAHGVSVRREGAEAGRRVKKAYAERTKDAKYPCVEKLFREIAPKYKARNAEKNCAGGYTRILKKARAAATPPRWSFLS